MGLPVFSWKKRGGREGGEGEKKIERERESFVCPSHNYISLPPPPSSLPPCLSLFFFFFLFMQMARRTGGNSEAESGQG